MQREKQQSGGGKFRGRRVWLAAMMVALIPGTICGLLLLRDQRPADERLADIEAARAIPEAENAAIIYNELLQNSRATSLSDSRPDSVSGSVFDQRLNEPWLAEDHPELAGWIRENQHIIRKLLHASTLEKCRFPISIDITDTIRMQRLAPTRQWAFLLTFAANNDLAEGRPDGAMAKWRCIIQLGNHMRQQPILTDHLVANGISRFALKSMARFVVAGDPSARHLQEIEAMPLPLADDWEQDRKQIRSIERLTTEKLMEPFSLWDRLRFPLYSYRMKRIMKKAQGMQKESPIESNGNAYRRNIATAQGLHILVALRHYRNDIGHWPKALDEISSSLPKTILTDPLNGCSFVYRRTADAFKLYSTGKNKIDEYGQRDSEGADDWAIWLPPVPSLEEKLKEIYGERYRIPKP